MKTITVKVTQDDIDQGIPESCEECPIALAIGRALNWEAGTESIAVGNDHVDFYGEQLETASLPHEARVFREFFDSQPPRMYDQPQPFSFELQIYETADVESPPK